MTHLSVHCGVGGNHNGLGVFLDQLVAAGFKPWLKSVDSYGPLIDATRRGGVGVFRLSTAGQGDGFDYDVPNYAGDPAAVATTHWAATKAKLPPEFDKANVWLEVINEVDKNQAEFLGAFALYIARLANADGYKVLMFGFSSGEPEPEFWEHPNVLEYVRYCGQHPDMAGIALHEYNYGHRPYAEVYPYHVGRFQWLYDACDRHGIARPLVAITEWGFSQDRVPTWDEGGDYAQECYFLYSRFNIDGPALWCLQAWHANVPNQANAFMKSMGPWMASMWPHVGDRNAPLDPAYFEPSTPPPSQTFEEWVWTEGMKLKVIDTNSAAALEIQIGKDGHLQTGNERWRTAPDGSQWAIQPAYSAQLGKDRVYYAPVGDWGNINWQGQPEPPIEPPPADRIIDIVEELPRHPSKTYRARPLSDITDIVIHHSAAAPTVDAFAIARYHVNNNDWPGIGYHFVVEADGTIYQTNELVTMSYHVGARNGQCVGVCLLGNFTDTPPPAAQQEAAAWLFQRLQQQLPGVNGTAHRLVPQTSTACPGNTYQQWLGNITGDPVQPPPIDPPPSNAVDLLPYFLPRSSEAWMLQTSWGPQEKVRGIHDQEARTFYHVKNSNWERLHYDASYIYRSIDTSPGPDNSGRDRYYTITDGELPYSKWMARRASPGEWFERSPVVRYFYKDGCVPITSYTDHSWLNVVALHKEYQFKLTGMVVRDVLELAWAQTRGGPAIERYWYAGGLVGWMRTDTGANSAIASFTAGDNQPEVIPCL